MTLVRSSRSDGQATISVDQNPPASRGTENPNSFAFILSLSLHRTPLYSSAQRWSSDRARAKRETMAQLPPPHRRVRSAAGERAAVKRPSRGALARSSHRTDEHWLGVLLTRRRGNSVVEHQGRPLPLFPSSMFGSCCVLLSSLSIGD